MNVKRVKSPARKFRHGGFTLIELMIGMLVGLLVSAAAVSAFVGHSRTVYQQMGYNQASGDVSEAYAVLSRLIMQAERDTITVTTSSTATTIVFALPEGFAIWPNTTTPYDKNWVRIAWTSTGNLASQITITNAVDGALNSASAKVFAGAGNGNATRITGMSLVEDDSEDISTYLFNISGKSYTPVQVADSSSAGIVVGGRILPRN